LHRSSGTNTLSTLGDEDAVKALLGELLYGELKAASLTANREAAVTVATATLVPVAEPAALPGKAGAARVDRSI